MSNHDDLQSVIRDCNEILDENIDVLSSIRYAIDNDEDKVMPFACKTQLIDRVHEVADSVRIKKAESEFIQRRLETDQAF
jgi:hypothetical protein